jgi:Thioesterase-like superfamily
MPSSTLFTDAMALSPAGDGVYDGELNEHWSIGPKVHGGAMLALCANAAVQEHGGGVQPIALSGNFLLAPEPGPMRVVTTVRKRGRRVSLVDVELKQGNRAAVRAAVTLGDPEHHVPPLLSVNPVIPLMQPESPPGLEPIGPGHPMADIVHLAHGCDIRPSLTTFTPRTDGAPCPHASGGPQCGDVSAPVTFKA